ncbi:MAG: serine/threonine-protein phosphatase, partial [Actinobacteria bacterium]|nr:serine/threonine-protein phosphatase [Actinomycetota bacterium]
GAPIGVELVCAGHPPPYLLRAPGDLEELCRPGPLLGAFDDASWEPVRLELETGDGIVLYTDGVTDAAAPDIVREPRDVAQMAGAGADDSAEDIADRVLGAAMADSGVAEPRDDIAILVLRACPAARLHGVYGSRAAVPNR